MRVDAAEVLAQMRRAPTIDDSIGSPPGGNYGRTTRLAQIEEEAMEFASSILTDFDLPSTPKLMLGNMKGFEDPSKGLKQVVGVITINAKFNTLNGQFIRIGLAIPIRRGAFQRPSIVYYNDKRRVLSQDFFDEIIASIQTNRPTINNLFSTRVEFQRNETIEQPEFSAPSDPSGWSLLLTERY